MLWKNNVWGIITLKEIHNVFLHISNNIYKKVDFIFSYYSIKALIFFEVVNVITTALRSLVGFEVLGLFKLPLIQCVSASIPSSILHIW